MYQSTKHLTVENNTSRIPVKSVSASLSSSYLPRPVSKSTSTSTTSNRQRTTITPAMRQSKSTIKQRATVTPQIHRRRTSSTSSNTSGGSSNWLANLLSSSSSSVTKKKKKIKSVVRLTVEKNSSEWQLDNDRTIRYLGPKSTKKFELDHLFRADSTNQDLFDSSIKPTVQDVVQGYSGTIFVYGQPKTGKSHTMFGNKGDPGVVPLALNSLFESIKNSDQFEYVFCISCFEIANEVIRDLLSDQGEALKISDENKRRGAYVSLLREQIIASPAEAMQFIKRAEANRYILTNNYEAHCSRAHTFVQVMVERREKPAAGIRPSMSSNASIVSSTSSSTSGSSRRTKVPLKKKHESIGVSYLNMIDLASNDKSIYQALKAPINKSCLALEAVVYNLSETGKSAGHPLPPYHDSKLTRLLQPAFSGQHNVVSICTIDMESASQDEVPTLDTLGFACRIRRIPISPKTSEISEEKSLLARYSNNITFLKLKLEKLEREEGKSSQDLSDVRSILEQRLYNTSRFVLSSQAIIHNVALVDGNTANEDPWKVVERLRLECKALNIDKNIQLDHLKSVMEETRSLPDEIAQLEAELNITKAELQVTQLLVNEAASSTLLY